MARVDSWRRGIGAGKGLLTIDWRWMEGMHLENGCSADRDRGVRVMRLSWGVQVGAAGTSCLGLTYVGMGGRCGGIRGGGVGVGNRKGCRFGAGGLGTCSEMRMVGWGELPGCAGAVDLGDENLCGVGFGIWGRRDVGLGIRGACGVGRWCGIFGIGRLCGRELCTFGGLK